MTSSRTRSRQNRLPVRRAGPLQSPAARGHSTPAPCPCTRVARRGSFVWVPAPAPGTKTGLMAHVLAMHTLHNAPAACCALRAAHARCCPVSHQNDRALPACDVSSSATGLGVHAEPNQRVCEPPSARCWRLWRTPPRAPNRAFSGRSMRAPARRLYSVMSPCAMIYHSVATAWQRAACIQPL